MVSHKTLKIFVLMLILVSCEKEEMAPKENGGEVNSQKIYPVSPSTWMGSTSPYFTAGWVGDIMPYFENGKFHIFFLHDAHIKPQGEGFHSIHKFESPDLVSFEYKGEVIPYGKAFEPDFAIGTGSVVKLENKYLFYYTGHNGTPAFVHQHPRESVLYAESNNFKSWVKNHSFILTAPTGYFNFEFRDPHVFYNEEKQEYWMLQSTQYSVSRRAVVLLFTTQDPENGQWEAKDPIYVASEEDNYLMLECVDIFKMGDFWYMFFSENWGVKGTHYRIANSSLGPWRKPEIDLLDGEYFYAAKTASDGEKRYAFGWTARRMPESDSGSKEWAGNMVIHEIIQHQNGYLGVKAPENVHRIFNQDVKLQIINNIGSVSQSQNKSELDGTLSTAASVYQEFNGMRKISGTITLGNGNGKSGFVFNPGIGLQSGFEILLEPEQQRIVAYRKENGQRLEVNRVPIKLEANKEYQFEMLVDESVCVLYLDGEVAFSNRIYALQGNSWGIIAEETQTVFSNIQMKRT